MEELFTAKSYRGLKWVTEPVEKNNKLYVLVQVPCPRCNGTGYLPYRVDNGICFKCKGERFFHEEVRLYTQKELDAQAAAAKRREERKIAELEAGSEDRKNEWREKHGFNKNDITYLVCGGDTYAIKDELKVLGAKFDNLLKWHFTEKVELPDGYTLVEVKFSDLYDWANYGKGVYAKDGAEEFVAKIFTSNSTEIQSEYVGNKGDKLQLTVEVKKINSYNSQFGFGTIYTFESEGNIFVWMTTANFNAEVGEVFDLVGTVKGFNDYHGVKQTMLTRCKRA